MALIAETRRQRDFHNRSGGRCQFVAGVFDAHHGPDGPSLVLPSARAVPPSESGELASDGFAPPFVRPSSDGKQATRRAPKHAAMVAYPFAFTRSAYHFFAAFLGRDLAATFFAAFFLAPVVFAGP